MPTIPDVLVMVGTLRFAHPTAARNDGGHATTFSRHDLPEFSISFRPHLNRGRREDRVHAAPAVSCAMCTEEVRAR
ncbi:hypothetical protein, partial [Bradyrhizobium jicamae]|uniref:hypothetical protein n=1 Tax=Bradyrhizobium jicamae TaxID=280332 RepID=UPI001BACF80C